MSETKTCSKCGEVKPVEMFRVKRRICKKCEGEAESRYRAANVDKRQTLRKNYYQKNRKEEIIRATFYRLLNPESAKKNMKEWREKNQVAIRKYQQSRRKEEKQRVQNTRDALGDSYIKILIAANTGMLYVDVTSELIEVKRKHLQILRAIKEKTK